MTDEQRAERLRYHMYESNEGIREHAERIVAPEELVAVMERSGDQKTAQAIISRLRETYRQHHCGDEDRRTKGNGVKA